MLRKELSLEISMNQRKLAFALIPLMTGLQHRDIIRLQRKMEFKHLVLSAIVPEFLITLMAYPVAVFYREYRAFIHLSILYRHI